jgi:hypothetical protein
MKLTPAMVDNEEGQVHHEADIGDCGHRGSSCAPSILYYVSL